MGQQLSASRRQALESSGLEDVLQKVSAVSDAGIISFSPSALRWDMSRRAYCAALRHGGMLPVVAGQPWVRCLAIAAGEVRV